MPPVYRKIKTVEVYDGNSTIDFRPCGINAIYIPSVISTEHAYDVFDDVLDANVLSQHCYVNPRQMTIRPSRYTFASVPHRRFYRYRGVDLQPITSEMYNQQISFLQKKINAILPDDVSFTSDATVSNGYRYDGKSCISPHTDDESFLSPGNCSYFSESTVCTFTLLDSEKERMEYRLADPETGVGFGILMGHGSALLQGSVLHEVAPRSSIDDPTAVKRISLTLRSLRNDCPHGEGVNCSRITCPQFKGPSNYLFYSNYHSRE